MRADLDMELIFPIIDEASANLMLVKATCLLQAGVISAADASAVFRRASEILYLCSSRKAA
jgi:hypothetical protein